MKILYTVQMILQLSRTINPNIWNEENYDQNLQEWFPEGYDNSLKQSVNEKINNDKLSIRCSVETRESMNFESENFLTICEVY